MDIVLGVSMTPTTVRMVLVEGEKADGSIVDHDAFDITANDGSATSLSAAEQVVEAVLGTKESATAGGHHLKSIGVTWSHHAEASTLRDALAARGVDDVMLVSDGHAAAALAQAVGRAVGYAATALLFIDRDTATLSVVQTDDGSVVKVLSRSLHSDDALAVLTEMAAAVDAQDSPPQGMFVVGSGVDVSSVKSHLENLVSLPVSAPDEPELALARGAALASATAPAFEATTVGLAYSQDPDGTTAGTVYAGVAAAETQLAPVSGEPVDDYAAQTDMEPIAARGGPQAVPARRQHADVDLRGWRCGAGHFARREHPADGRSAAQPRAERDRAEPTAAPAPAPVQEAQHRPSRRPSTCGDHQTAGARRRAGGPRASAGAAPGVRRAGPRPASASARPTTGCATACTRGAAARTASRGTSAGALYSGAGVQPAGVQPLPAAAGVLPAAQAVVTSVSPPWQQPPAGPPRTAGATGEPAVAGIRRRLGSSR